ncbi:hypothetical protein BDZ89DRAFT_1039342 [Hymenopellis radicata]|nr:hypothetical protein BDZ89DRAFT_1039342 [Hymenopellis radicata]
MEGMQSWVYLQQKTSRWVALSGQSVQPVRSTGRPCEVVPITTAMIIASSGDDSSDCTRGSGNQYRTDDKHKNYKYNDGKHNNDKQAGMITRADNSNIEWRQPDHYEVVRRLGGGKYSEVPRRPVPPSQRALTHHKDDKANKLERGGDNDGAENGKHKGPAGYKFARLPSTATNGCLGRKPTMVDGSRVGRRGNKDKDEHMAVNRTSADHHGVGNGYKNRHEGNIGREHKPGGTMISTSTSDTNVAATANDGHDTDKTSMAAMLVTISTNWLGHPLTSTTRTPPYLSEDADTEAAARGALGDINFEAENGHGG